MKDQPSDEDECALRYRKYLEGTKGNPFSDITLVLLDMGMSLHIPKPMTPEILEKYYEAGVIRKEDLQIGAYYWGRCRNSSLAMWDGKEFIYLRTKFSSTFSETINHLADDNGYDLFVPIKKLNFIEDET
jgi:hypothetical protein